MEQRISDLESNFLKAIDDIQVLKQIITEGFTRIEKNFSAIETDIKVLHSKVDSLTKGLAGLSTGLNGLAGETTSGFTTVDMHLVKITEELGKINTVTNYGSQIENQKKFTSH